MPPLRGFRSYRFLVSLGVPRSGSFRSVRRLVHVVSSERRAVFASSFPPFRLALSFSSRLSSRQGVAVLTFRSFCRLAHRSVVRFWVLRLVGRLVHASRVASRFLIVFVASPVIAHRKEMPRRYRNGRLFQEMNPSLVFLIRTVMSLWASRPSARPALP